MIQSGTIQKIFTVEFEKMKQSELWHKIKHSLYDFTETMKGELFSQLEEKGDSYNSIDPEYLKEKLAEHANVGHWVVVANYAFMLDATNALGRDKSKSPKDQTLFRYGKLEEQK